MERADEVRAREERQMIEVKMERVREAERQRDEPLDDSQMVDQMFDFLPPDSASETQAPPSRFQVRSGSVCIIILQGGHDYDYDGAGYDIPKKPYFTFPINSLCV